MLRVAFKLNEYNKTKVVKTLGQPYWTNIETYIDLGNFKYRYMYKIDFEKSSITVGIGFNSGRGVGDDCFIEFNPNKVGGNECDDLMVYLLSKSERRTIRIVRYDIAIDIPIARELCLLEKDGRVYETHQRSYEDSTEYLGVRNKPGRVKLYNKQKESSLDKPLTRLEITFGEETIDKSLKWQCEQYIPKVYIRGNPKQIGDTDNLDSTDRVLIELLQKEPNPIGYLKRLGRVKRKKIEPYVLGDAQLDIDIHSVKNIIYQVFDYVNECHEKDTIGLKAKYMQYKHGWRQLTDEEVMQLPEGYE